MTSGRHPYLREPPFVMAHRGFSPAGLENSMAAFAAAVALGVGHLETDVHATADGVLIAFHDARLDRVTDRRGPVAGQDWSQVSRALIGGQEPIPRLEDVLDAWPDVRLNVDVKAAGAIRPLAELLARRRCTDRVLVSSFSDRRRRAVIELLARLTDKPAAPSTPESSAGSTVESPAGSNAGSPAWSPGVRGTAAVWLAARLGRDVRSALGGACCVQVPERAAALRVLTPEFVRAVHEAGAQVHVWTVDDPGDMRRLVELGVDALVTNRADLALDVLREIRETR